MSAIKELDDFIDAFKKNKSTRNTAKLPTIFKIIDVESNFKNSSSNNFNSDGNSSQVLVKNISNLDKASVKNCLSYVINNSENNYATNELDEQKNIKEILDNWEKDFSSRKNSKEA